MFIGETRFNESAFHYFSREISEHGKNINKSLFFSAKQFETTGRIMAE
jgi:hypothetical protein